MNNYSILSSLNFSPSSLLTSSLSLDTTSSYLSLDNNSDELIFDLNPSSLCFLIEPTNYNNINSLKIILNKKYMKMSIKINNYILKTKYNIKNFNIIIENLNLTNFFYYYNNILNYFVINSYKINNFLYDFDKDNNILSNLILTYDGIKLELNLKDYKNILFLNEFLLLQYQIKENLYGSLTSSTTTSSSCSTSSSCNKRMAFISNNQEYIPNSTISSSNSNSFNKIRTRDLSKLTSKSFVNNIILKNKIEHTKLINSISQNNINININNNKQIINDNSFKFSSLSIKNYKKLQNNKKNNKLIANKIYRDTKITSFLIK